MTTEVSMSSNNLTPITEATSPLDGAEDGLKKTGSAKKKDDMCTFSLDDTSRKSRGTKKEEVLTFIGSNGSRQGRSNPLTKEGRRDSFSEASSKAVSSRISRTHVKGSPEVVTPRMPSVEPHALSIPISNTIISDPQVAKHRKMLKLLACLCGLLCGAVGIFFTSEIFEGLGDGRMALAFAICVIFIITQLLLMERSLKIIENTGSLSHSHKITFGRRQSMCPTKHGTATLGGSVVTLPRSNQGDLHDTTLSGIFDDEASTYTQRITTAGSETGSDSFSSRSHSVLKASTRRRRQRQLDHEEYRKATVVVVGIKTRATGPGSDAFVAHLTVLMQQIVEITTKHNGTPHSLLGEKVVLSFNTATDNMSHQQAANLTALFLTNSTQNSGHVSAAISCGKVLCGTLGCESLRNYSVCGDPVTKATAMEKLTRALKIPILVDHEVRRSCIDLMIFRYADSVVSAAADFPPEHIYQLLANKAFNSKEWMYYETPYDEGATALLEGKYDQAEAYFASYLLTSPNDDSALRLMGFAQSKSAPPYSTILF
eukprot:TRINITY_DN30556_c0_g1_i1.p1 TRINITY_DN30556_c0_g1~~TRINITY_DN30556_c0_g1_i1.p1  ORF type:complete len:542 (+),score=68.05 TRINITY_DN30556_c0_g1_i1:92-1717(+)